MSRFLAAAFLLLLAIPARAEFVSIKTACNSRNAAAKKRNTISP